MRVGELTTQFEDLALQLLIRAAKTGFRLGYLHADIINPEVVVEHRLGTLNCGPVRVSHIHQVRTINNAIVITLDQ